MAEQFKQIHLDNSPATVQSTEKSAVSPTICCILMSLCVITLSTEA